MERFLERSSSTGNLNAKRPAEGSPEDWMTPKRYAVNTSPPAHSATGVRNKFQKLPVDVDVSDQNNRLQTATSAVKKTAHIPPIVLDVKKDWTHQTIKDIVGKYTSKYHLQYRSGSKIAITCYTTDAHQAVKEGLRKDNASFVTYTRKDEKTPKIVIRGLPDSVEKDLPSELESMGFKIVTVTKLKSKGSTTSPCPPFLVHLEAGTDIAQLRQIKYLFNCVISIEKFKPNRSQGTQCFRCQGFGHSSQNCNLTARCVKCLIPHLTSECPKKDRLTPARCCNCQGEHPANYKSCSARVAYLENIQKKKELQQRKLPPMLLSSHPSSVVKPADRLPTKSWAAVAGNSHPRYIPPASSCNDQNQSRSYGKVANFPSSMDTSTPAAAEDAVMGSAASASMAEVPGGDLRLPASGLRFTVNQLRALNSYVDTLWEDDQKDRISTELESTIENLVQRIVDGAGQKDPRFRCSHLIALHRGKKIKSRSLEYLVTLDALPVLNSSEECHLVEGALGYGRIRLSAREADRWQDLLTPSGYLCRDKVVERWVELIARCTSMRAPATATASRVLTAPAHAAARPYTYCYLERVSSSNIQSPLDRRLAIVEGSAWVMVRAGSAEAKLVLGARVRGVPGPAIRLPVTHPMAMLHYTASQQGYYAVAIAPPSSMVCGDRGSNWQLWNPALEATLDVQLSDLATAAKVAAAVNALVDYMREGAYQGSLLSVSRYQAWCCWRKRLQRCWRLPTAAARAFVSAHASHHMLLVLDELYSICANNTPAGYWIPVGRQSLGRRGARGPRWEADAACIRQCLIQLHRTTGEEIPPTPAENLETALFSRWESLNKESAASAGGTYSKRQLRYLHALFGQLVACHSLMDTESPSTFHLNLLQATSSFDQQSVEDLIHILAIILDQARELYVTTFHSSAGNQDEDLKAYRTKKWLKLKDYYDASSACLIDAVRRDPDLRTIDLTDPIQNTKTILKWLNKGAKEDKKYLGPVLRPYLDGLFVSSLENCWFYDSFDQQDQELEGLKEYCLGVHEGLDACTGLVEAAKMYTWAKVLVDFVDRFKHVEFRLVFPTGDGMGVCVPVRLPRGCRSLTLSRADKQHAKLRLSRRALSAAVAATLTATAPQKLRKLPRHESEEILASVKSGNYWRNSTKPDIIPSTQDTVPRVRRRSRRSRPATSHGFPEISITKESDAKTLRRKYHTLKSLVYTEPVDVKEMRQRPRSAGSSVRHKEAMSRPSILETMDFINSVKDALNVEESGASDVEDSVWSATDEWWAGWCAPLNVATGRRGGAGVDGADGVGGGAPALHLTPHDLAPALLRRGCFTILQEISVWLVSGREGALFALHRLARDARSRSSERKSSSWKLPEEDTPHQQYRARPPDYMSGDEAPPPPPLPRTSSTRIQVLPRYPDYHPPNRIQNNSQHNPTYSQSTTQPIPNTKQSTTRNSFGSTDFQRDKYYPNIVQQRGETGTQRSEMGSQRGEMGSQRGESGSQRGEFGSTFHIPYEPKQSYTGIINPIYDIKMPKDKFQVNQTAKVKRSRSLGRSFSTKSLGIEVTKYNLTLGQRSGKKTNDVVTAITGMSGETAVETKGNFFQRRTTAEVVGDSYRVSRVTID